MEKKRRRRKKKMHPVIKILLILMLLAVIAVGSVVGFIFWEYTSEGTTGGPEVTFEVKQGQGVKSIAANLKEQGLIKSEIAFILKVREMGVSSKLRYGTFVLNEGAGIETLINQLLSGGAQKESKTFTIPEGYSIEKMAVKLEEDGICTAADFLAAVEMDYDYSFLSSIPDNDAIKYRLQGFLYPDTYAVTDDMTAEDIVNMMLRQFDNKFTTEMRSKAEALGKSIFEVVVEASVVEREAQLAEERSIIAGVFNNRIEQGMPLQVDATVLYPLTDGMYDVQRVFYADLEIDSLYNTYRYPGLPVGPICSPGISCLEAVVEPAEHNYLYYHTDEVKKDGSHIFTETYSQHLQTQ